MDADAGIVGVPCKDSMGSGSEHQKHLLKDSCAFPISSSQPDSDRAESKYHRPSTREFGTSPKHGSRLEPFGLRSCADGSVIGVGRLGGLLERSQYDSESSCIAIRLGLTRNPGLRVSTLGIAHTL